MLTGLGTIEWNDPQIGIPAFLTVATIPLTWSIADGLSFGLTSYALLQLLTGRARHLRRTGCSTSSPPSSSSASSTSSRIANPRLTAPRILASMTRPTGVTGSALLMMLFIVAGLVLSYTTPFRRPGL